MKLQHRINPLHKEASKADIKAKRNNLESSPVSLNLIGNKMLFHADDLSMKRMSAQIRNMKRSGKSRITWGLVGSDTVTMTFSELQEVEGMIQNAIDDRVDRLHRREVNLLRQRTVTMGDIESWTE